MILLPLLTAPTGFLYRLSLESKTALILFKVTSFIMISLRIAPCAALAQSLTNIRKSADLALLRPPFLLISVALSDRQEKEKSILFFLPFIHKLMRLDDFIHAHIERVGDVAGQASAVLYDSVLVDDRVV